MASRSTVSARCSESFATIIPGETIELEAMRYGQRKTFRVTLMEAQTDRGRQRRGPEAAGPTGVPSSRARDLSRTGESGDRGAGAACRPRCGSHGLRCHSGRTGVIRSFSRTMSSPRYSFPAPRRAVNTPAELQQVLSRLKNGDYVSLRVYSLDDRHTRRES